MADINMDNQQPPTQPPIQPPNPPPMPTPEQIQQYIAQQVRLHIGQQNNNNINSVKAAKPPMYNGKLGTDPTVWLFQMKQYFDITNAPLAQRPMIASTYLIDNAATWWQTFTSIQPNGNSAHITWRMFHDALTEMFKPVNSKKVARASHDTSLTY